MRNSIKREQYLEALKPLTELVGGWDGYKGHPVSTEAVDAVATFLSSLYFIPGSDGSVQIESYLTGISLEIDFAADGWIQGLYIDDPHKLSGHPISKIKSKMPYGGLQQSTYMFTKDNKFYSFELSQGD